MLKEFREFILLDRLKSEPPIDAQTRDGPDCLSAIPVLAHRCAFCTWEVPAQ